MSFAALGWCKQAILFITITYCYGVQTTPLLAGEAQQNISFGYNSLSINYQPENSKLNPEKSSCQKLDVDYQEIYGFETENYYISICQLESNFYYYRQSKIDSSSRVLVSAQAVFGGSVFKATNDKTVYFVGKDGDRYYSSVMLNSNEVVLEPALLPTPTSFSADIVSSGVKFSFGEVRLDNSHQNVGLDWPEQSQYNREFDNSLVCIRDSSALDPSFDDWQSLLGQSPEVANHYATDNGHHFIYDNVSPKQALIKTKEGKVVNLDIAATSEIIEQVCVQPTKGV